MTDKVYGDFSRKHIVIMRKNKILRVSVNWERDDMICGLKLNRKSP